MERLHGSYLFLMEPLMPIYIKNKNKKNFTFKSVDK